MNEDILNQISQPNSESHSQVLSYFEYLKTSNNGWETCASALLSGQYQSNDQIRFFCFQVIEHFLTKTYPTVESSITKQNVRNFIVNILQRTASPGLGEKSYIKNKLAQIVSHVFVVDYPNVWLTFFTDIIQFASLSVEAADLYIRVLKAIDADVVDREVNHSVQEQNRNTDIKDFMRGQCVPQLVNSWYDLMVTYESSQPQLTCQCLDVVGLYVAWIDINLIANDRMVHLLIKYLKIQLLRESACECLTEIVHKGMDPEAKVKLIESFTSVLESAGVMFPNEDEEGDFVVKLAKLVNEMGENLVEAWNKSVKCARGQEASSALNAIEGKVSMMCRYLSDEDDDVSATICPFASDYIGVLKQLKPLTDKQKENVQNILMIILKKLEFSPDYDFNDEGEDEAMFQEYRKTLKGLFASIAKMDQSMILMLARQVLASRLEQWRHLDFKEVEVALLLVYMLGEALPAPHNQHFKGDSEKATALQEMLKMIVTSEVSQHSHQAVSLQFFETIVRYEKFFQLEPDCIIQVLTTFLDERGLRHPCSSVRSRVSYLFTKFIKAVRGSLQPYTDNILKQMDGLLSLNQPYVEKNGAQIWLTNEEQMFLYEVASQLIVSSNLAIEQKHSMMLSLLKPVIQDFSVVYTKLCQEADENRQQAYAECLSCAMSFASRASKGFSNQLTMKSCGCVEVFTNCLDMFIQALNSPYQRTTLQQGVRQFFHRMVVCLESDILPFIPTMVKLMLETPDVKELYDFIPMLNQLVTKFKRTIQPFLQEAFMPLVVTIFRVLNAPIDTRDTVTLNDKKMLRRGYFTFIANLVNSDLADVIKNQEGPNIEHVLMTVVQGCSEFPDPAAQKSCFSILKQLIELWSDIEGFPVFTEFTHKHIIPACILTPTKNSFDWRDAQTVLLLGDIAACLQAAYGKEQTHLVTWLHEHYFPSLHLDSSQSQQFCTELTGDKKKFKEYLKAFYSNFQNR